jgi:hypothetical protein
MPGDRTLPSLGARALRPHKSLSTAGGWKHPSSGVPFWRPIPGIHKPFPWASTWKLGVLPRLSTTLSTALFDRGPRPRLASQAGVPGSQAAVTSGEGGVRPATEPPASGWLVPPGEPIHRLSSFPPPKLTQAIALASPAQMVSASDRRQADTRRHSGLMRTSRHAASWAGAAQRRPECQNAASR